MKSNPFQYTITARPTFYNGTQYRSELEAAWAAFFEIRGITFEYEPALDLREWRPDFMLQIQDCFEFAEVKPFISVEQWKSSGILEKIASSLEGKKISILLGASPLVAASFIFKIESLPIEQPEFEVLDFGDLKDVERDWKRAKNAVQWRPNGRQ